MTRISTRQLTRDGNKLVAFISDFGPDFRFEQVYPDACDQGFTLVSHKTGFEVTVVNTHTETQDGEIKWWEFKPTAESKRRVPLMRDFEVTLFND